MPEPTGELTAMAALLREGSVMVLSGAGISTESGIPDYRGPASAGSVRTPITYQEFVRDEHARKRYWARSMVGWRGLLDRQPNAGHIAVAELERRGHLVGVVTQNVDGLHQAAGSERVIELHGNLERARCLDCGSYEQRQSLQARLNALNPEFAHYAARDDAQLAPDGDADVPRGWVESLTPAACLVCGGMLKPDVVFFGENVPRPRLEGAWDLLAEASSLLVVGSSLHVMSGYRFVRAALAAEKPVAIVNQGPTRGDADAAVRIEGRLGVVLPAAVGLLDAKVTSSHKAGV